MSFRIGSLDGRAVLLRDDSYFDLKKVTNGRLPADPMEAFERYKELDDVYESLDDATPEGSISEVELGPPVPRPQKVFAIGLNYRAHAAETGRDAPTEPLIFTKFPSCLVGPRAIVELRSDSCDWEVELVAVIGAGGRDIVAEKGWDHVAGLMVGQDVSDRGVQFAGAPAQFSMGKSFDTFGPTGPAVVSSDLLPDRDDLAISCSVSGESKQAARTSDLIFSIPELIAFISRITTLAPGDLIFTGTPSGVGAPTKTFLRDGDVIESTIEGLGTMVNRCARASD